MNNYEIIKIQGFDKDGEPEIKKFQDGHIELQFNFMVISLLKKLLNFSICFAYF